MRPSLQSARVRAPRVLQYIANSRNGCQRLNGTNKQTRFLIKAAQGVKSTFLHRPQLGNEYSSTSITKLRHKLHEDQKQTQHPPSISAPSTIYALSTAPGRAAIAIIRISGPACLDIYRDLCPGKPILKERTASVRTLNQPTADTPNDILDSDAIVVYFPGPKTVTGESILELHIHGGPATVKAVLSAIPHCASTFNIRYAEPGEFTRRAFENGRLDLAQVEALSDTLSADTEQQRRAAVRGKSGALGRTYEAWRKQLLYARGELEAIIDFSEDQDFDALNAEILVNITKEVKAMLISIGNHEEAGRRGELLRNGIRISMLGPPNAGKSSLLNRIVGREASIVSTEAGTTRDVVEVNVDIAGYLCTFADTAGLRSHVAGSQNNISPRESIGQVEQEGIRRAKAKAAESDIIIAFASVEPVLDKDQSYSHRIVYDLETLQIASRAQRYIIVVNKMDIIPNAMASDVLARFRASLERDGLEYSPESVITISCRPKSPEHMEALREDPGNIKQLIERLVHSFKDLTTYGNEDLLGVTERQRQLLQSCRHHCLDYLEETQNPSYADNTFDIVLAAEHLRAAGNCLSRITGRGEGGDVEEVLGVVFEKFCVGK